jgi:uncharacterized protein YjbJ (UPF0337 family)
MGADDKVSNKAHEVKGEAKRRLGRATDDERLEAEGHREKTGSKLRQAAEKAKDAAAKAKDAFKG